MKKIVLLLLFVNELNAMETYITYYVRNFTNGDTISMELSPQITIAEAMKKYTREHHSECHNLDLLVHGQTANPASTLDLIGSKNFTLLTCIQQLFNFSKCITNDKFDGDNNIIEKVKKLEENYRAINSQETYDSVAADWCLIKDELLEKNLDNAVKEIQKIFDSSTYAFNFEVLDLTSHLDSLNSDPDKFSPAERKLLEMIKSLNLLKISDEKELRLLQKLYYRFLIEIYTEHKQDLDNFKLEPNNHKVILEVNDYLQRYNDLKKNIPLEFFFEEEMKTYFKGNVAEEACWENFSMLLAFLKQTDDTIKLLRPIVNTLIHYSRDPSLPKKLKNKANIMQKQIINYKKGLFFSIEGLPTLLNIDNFLNENATINESFELNFRKAVPKFQIAHYGLTNARMIESIEFLLAKYKNDKTPVSYFIKELSQFIRQRTMSGASFVKKAR